MRQTTANMPVCCKSKSCGRGFGLWLYRLYTCSDTQRRRGSGKRYVAL